LGRRIERGYAANGKKRHAEDAEVKRRMRLHCIRARIAALAGFFAIFTLACFAPANAGGVNLGNDDDDNNTDTGPAFFGFVRDPGGAAIGDAKVTATVKAGGALVTRSNVMGVYKIPGMGKGVDPDSVEISCAKDGYKQANVVRRPHAADEGNDPIEVECYLQKE
jgi:hypothetical protein